MKEDLKTPSRRRTRKGGGRSRTSAPKTAPGLSDLDRRLRSFARNHPLVTVGLAITTGYLVGRLMSRL